MDVSGDRLGGPRDRLDDGLDSTAVDVSDNSASSAGGIQPKTRQGGGPPLALIAGLHGISSSADRAGVYEAVAGRHALVSD